ncbi:hypothetical protein B0H16DRAFT_1893424 [Mycena metata]|uniref:Uncharacterized protein n=1 Tax=Mycena metata TaxID=1033252 RepID=A0AAD7HYY2_9AGAR|nr:hypothetical protein B0H16DRAFT_1893424 [Mycena metata]
MYDNYMFGTVKTYSRKEHNSPGSLSKVIDQLNADKRRTRLCEGRCKEAKAKGYRKPVLRLMKKKGLSICTKEGRSAVVTAFVRKLDANINKRTERDPKRGTKCAAVISSSRVPEKRIVSNPPTPASALSRVLPVGVPIDVWTPKCYNEELDAREKAMYIDTGVAFPLDKFCNDQDVAKWAKMPAKQFMEKCASRFSHFARELAWALVRARTSAYKTSKSARARDHELCPKSHATPIREPTRAQF